MVSPLPGWCAPYPGPGSGRGIKSLFDHDLYGQASIASSHRRVYPADAR